MERSLFPAYRNLIILVLMTMASSATAQSVGGQNWWFGNGPRGIQFTTPGDTARLMTRPTAGVALYGNGGGVVAADPFNGTLLFYSDGASVYDATHRAMPNGAALGGNAAANQPAVVSHRPGQQNQYFLITNNAGYLTPGQVRFTVVDMNQLGNNTTNPNLGPPPLGDVDVANKAVAIPNLANAAQAMIVIPNSSNTTDYWLITQEAGTDAFRVSTIDAAGITAPAVATPAGSGFPFSAAHFAYYPETGKLAVTPENAGNNVMIFDFDAAAGTVTFEEFVFTSAVTTPITQDAIYDAAWSKLGRYLYISRTEPPSIVRFDTENTGSPLETMPTPPGMVRSFGLELAPDSTIYHIYQDAANAFHVGRITNTDSVANLVGYTPDAFGNLNFNAKQFPSFLATTLDLTLDFTVSGTCANSPTTFFPHVSPTPDSIYWEFEAGASARQWSPSYTYTTGGPKNVIMRAYLNGDSLEYSETVNITQFDLQLTLVQDTTACSCELPFPKEPTTDPGTCTLFSVTAQATGATGDIQWYGPSGLLATQTTLTLRPDSSGFYYVTVQDPAGTGCFAYAGVNIKEYGVDDPRSNIWHFGNGAGLNFNADFKPTTGVDPIDGPVNSPEGTAVICDRNGQVIISTDGQQVYDRTGAPLSTVPPGLGGSPGSTQSALIIPFPDDETMYYIFTTQEVYPETPASNYELRYAIFDLKIAPNGALVDTDDDPTNGMSSVLFTRSTERITGNEGWLIAHEYGNNNFRAYPIGGQGIGTPVTSSIGSVHSLAVAENARGYMKLSPNGRLAVALSTPGVSNVIEIFDFDGATGVISEFRQVDLAQTGGTVYGLEFSPSGSKLFASTNGGVNALHEFAFDSIANTYVKKPTIPVVNPGAEIGAIQRGPDGTIYVATNGASALGTINPNEDDETPSTFNAGAQPLTKTSTLGLPNFIQNISDPQQSPTLAATGFCLGSPTDFTGSGTDPIDTLTWFFGDGSSQRGVNLSEVSHTYDTAGRYLVTLRISNRCVGFIRNDTLTVIIHDVPPDPTFSVNPGIPPVICNSTSGIMQALRQSQFPNWPDFDYAWSTGETTNEITVTRQGIYSVTITNEHGCTSEGEILVPDVSDPIALGPDQNACTTDDPLRLDTGIPSNNHTWTINGAPVANNTQFQNVDRTVAGTFTYAVSFINTLTGCTSQDDITYVVNPTPAITAGYNAPSACNVSDGSVTLRADSPAGSQFNYTVSNGGGAGVIPGTGITITTPTPGTLGAGSYLAIVGEQITGCEASQSVTISNDAFTANIAQAGGCELDPANPLLLGVSSNIAAAFNYSVILSNSNQVVEGPTPGPGALPFNTAVPLQDDETYLVQIRRGDGCIQFSDPLTLNQGPEVNVGFDPSFVCSQQMTATSTSPGTISFDWSDSEAGSITSAANIATVTLNTGNWDLVVLADDGPGALCPAQNTITVTIDATTLPTVTQNAECFDQVTLTASPAGTYLWTRTQGASSTTFTAGSSIVIGLADHGAVYGAQFISSSICASTPGTHNAIVRGELLVNIENLQPCRGTDFTLTANTNRDAATYNWSLNKNALSEPTRVLTVTDDKGGIYKVVASDGTCSAEDQVEITVDSPTPSLLRGVFYICPDAQDSTRIAVLDPGPGFITFNWSTGESTPTIVVERTDRYAVELTNSVGCITTDEAEVFEECNPRISGPNAFRPGGINQEFFLYTFFIDDADFHIFIFNRWGEMIYESGERDFRWNGGYNNNLGRPLPPGTYSYVVKYKSAYRPEEGVKEKRGGVVLLR